MSENHVSAAATAQTPTEPREDAPTKSARKEAAPGALWLQKALFAPRKVSRLHWLIDIDPTRTHHWHLGKRWPRRRAVAGGGLPTSRPWLLEMEPLHHDGVSLEEVLANGGPTLSEVFADPVLSQALYRHMVSRFAPESILFRNAVIAYQDAVRSGRVEQVLVWCCSRAALTFL
jgi:hypothetical protein